MYAGGRGGGGPERSGRPAEVVVELVGPVWASSASEGRPERNARALGPSGSLPGWATGRAMGGLWLAFETHARF